ncbi:MAG: hypothetical protein CVU94_08790 [Firmicutes bacterium HGW-Firmicutes-19]|nr:MAG: hypothetical protein CVU94_08790 [Firmicutes bacterium HGW-Firmicutes-19]
MSKNEYLNLLKKKLEFADVEFIDLLIADFEAHFEAGAAEGLSEAEIISHLGDIDEIVESLDVDHLVEQKKEKTSKTVEGKVKHVVVDGKFADVTVVPSLNGKVEVNMINKGGLLSKFTNTMIGEQKGDVFEIRVLPLFNVSSDVDMKISVTLPDTLLSCKVMTSSGDIDYTKISFDGDCIIKTASGDVSIIDCKQKSYDIQMASGDLKFQNSFGNLHVKSASGDVMIKEGRGVSLACSLASGDLIANGVFDKVDVAAVSGDMKLELSDAASLSISSVNGDGSIRLKNMDSIHISVSSVSGYCKINEPAGEHKLRNRQELILKDGIIPCKVSTVDGEIVINMG